eukprot:TRINITY_DN181_c1_g1_i1.p2 TRINITY_DN181_c1_g1~~TRINITY_DN181_c1_g1_i1.p2  ORF type:complete len:160 (-),score=38.53 TRINITY_DN181_c1_g1_i1:607-1086(-)
MFKMESRLASQRCNAKKEKRKTQFTKIAAPRPLALIALKNSAGAGANGHMGNTAHVLMTSPQERDWEEAMESFISQRRRVENNNNHSNNNKNHSNNEDEDDDDEASGFSFSSDLEAESELQQIFGSCGFQATATGLESLLLSSSSGTAAPNPRQQRVDV